MSDTRLRPRGSNMEVRITGYAKAPVSADLGRIRRAVAQALRAEGCTVPSDAAVQVEGKLG